jgi:hypothetical protein
MILIIAPMLPALANKVTSANTHIPKELSNPFTINWLYVFITSRILYYAPNFMFPDQGTLISHAIQADTEVVEGVIGSSESTEEDNSYAEKELNVTELVES